MLGALVAAPVAACGRQTQGQSLPPPGAAPSLKRAAAFPVGCAVSAARLADREEAALIVQNFSQLTAEWEMKMEYILRDDGGLRFDAPDAIADFARDQGLRLFGHNLVWYYQNPPAFVRLDGQPAPFGAALRDYIQAVVGRYRGQAVGWDVVNEPVTDDGAGLRECLWSRNLGQIDYMRRAFDHAHEADPAATLLINDYNLESNPRKRATFMRLVETLLGAGTPVGGVGTQTHVAADLPPSVARQSLLELASLGLPVHVSELDISLRRARPDFGSREQLVAAQTRLAREIAETFAQLPPARRFAFTLWGVKSDESWLRSPKENPAPPWDEPLAFDDEGFRRPMFDGLAAGFSGAG